MRCNKTKSMRFIVFIVVMIVLLGVFQSLSFAQNYYAVTEIQKKGKRGTIIAMMTVTKVFDENTCKTIAIQKGSSKGPWVTSSECVTGQEWDKNFSNIFANQPISGLYISFTDLNGYETRVKWSRLTGANSPVPGFPVDLPVEGAVLLANETIKELKARGIKNAKIIYPDKKK